MRRYLPPILVGLGVFLLAIAVLLPTVVLPRVEKAPLDAYSIVEATGPGTYFNPETRQFVDDEVLVRRVAKGLVEQGTDELASYEYAQIVLVPDLEEPLDALSRDIVFDRKTGVDADGRGADEAQYVKFPFNTKKGDYLLYEPTLADSFPVSFEQETEIDGLEVYEFRGSVPEEVTGSLGVPGALVGAPDAATTFVEEVYSNPERVVYVEPRTGRIVGAENSPRRTWRPAAIAGAEPGEETVIFEADLSLTSETTEELVAQAEDDKSQLRLVGVILPIVLGLLGLLSLVAGLLLLSRSRRDARYDDDVRYDQGDPVY